MIGFLWVIDLGVGLIFFIFTLHFTTFLHQKSNFSSSSKYFFSVALFILFSLIYLYFFSKSTDSFSNTDLSKIWFLNVVYLDFYTSLFHKEANVLLMLKHVYFSFNSFEFYIINYSLFFGLIATILTCFLVKRFYVKLLFSQIIESKSVENINSCFFIRNQNYYHQQGVHHSTRVWSKVKNN